jgi:hypothetical protein
MNGWPIVAEDKMADDPARLIHQPLGLPGSGRVRYAAAMALYRAGRLGASELEVYREAAAFDGRDPARMLADLGLAPVPPAPADAASLLRALFDQACDHLHPLRHPGQAEVREGLARVSGPPRPPARVSNPIFDRWFAPALAAADRSCASLTSAIAAAAPHLAWVTYDGYPRDQIGVDMAIGHACALIVGEGAPFAATDFDLGLFLIAPHTLYRDHTHAAPELYAPLTGPHGWRFGPGRPLLLKPALAPVWNPAFQPHLIKVGAVPFLSLFVWTRDLAGPGQVLPATDWPELEKLHLG